MDAPPESGYRHTQHGPWHLLLDGFGAALLVVAWTSGEPVLVRLQLVFLGALFLLVGACFHHLTVEDAGDRLAVRFGPLPLFRTAVRYDDITSVAVGRTSLLDGWGVHYSLRGGWVWNIWGGACVVIHRRKGRLFLGTDDAPALVDFLAHRAGGVVGSGPA